MRGSPASELHQPWSPQIFAALLLVSVHYINYYLFYDVLYVHTIISFSHLGMKPGKMKKNRNFLGRVLTILIISH